MLIKNTTKDDLDVPTIPGEFGGALRVAAGETVEVTGEDAKALLRNSAFERVDEPKPRKHDDEPADAAPEVGA